MNKKTLKTHMRPFRKGSGFLFINQKMRPYL